MKFWSYSFLLKNLLGMMLILGLYPLLSVLFLERGFFVGPQWGLWLLFYFFLSLTFVFYAISRLFLGPDAKLYTILYLTFFIGLSAVLKIIPLPLGMSLAFVLPILIGGFVHPLWGSLVGFFMVMVSAMLTGGIGPWTPIQVYLLIVIPGALMWFPHRVRNQKWILALYGLLWGILYGFLTSLYFWPILASPMEDQTHVNSFVVYYIGTSFLWDLFRGFGNAVFIYVLYKPVQQAVASVKLEVPKR